MIISLDIEYKRDFTCVKCRKIAHGTQCHAHFAAFSMQQAKDNLESVINATHPTDFPVGWAKSDSGLFCERCK